MKTTKYPDIEVKLTGTDGNAFFIIGRVRSALKDAGVPGEEIDAFTEEATSGDYDNVLRVVDSWVTVY